MLYMLNNTKKVEIKSVHIGKEIESRMNYLRLSKSEFGRQIGIPQQNVNRILCRKSIDTDKLAQISEVLNYNFFALFYDDSDTYVSYNGDSDVPHSDDLAAMEKDVLIQQLVNANQMLCEKERTIRILMAQLKIDIDK